MQLLRRLWDSVAAFSRLYCCFQQRHDPAMWKWESIFALIAELVRTLFVDEISERVRGRLPRIAGVRGGMPAVRRRIHRRCRSRLFNRLSTRL